MVPRAPVVVVVPNRSCFPVSVAIAPERVSQFADKLARAHRTYRPHTRAARTTVRFSRPYRFSLSALSPPLLFLTTQTVHSVHGECRKNESSSDNVAGVPVRAIVALLQVHRRRTLMSSLGLLAKKSSSAPIKKYLKWSCKSTRSLRTPLITCIICIIIFCIRCYRSYPISTLLISDSTITTTTTTTSIILC